jgi:hypothetical protein
MTEREAFDADDGAWFRDRFAELPDGKLLVWLARCCLQHRLAVKKAALKELELRREERNRWMTMSRTR